MYTLAFFSDNLKNSFSNAFSPDALIKVALILIIGIPLVFIASSFVKRFCTIRISAHAGLVFYNFIFYSGILLVAVSVLLELEVELKPLIGAGGILAVGLAFASQTSLSNLISGLFLLGEKPFQIGDRVEVGSHNGWVISIDLMSVKLRTSDNRLLRVPNEVVIKSDLINHTRFPIRRFDMLIPVDRDEDITRVLAVLQDIAESDPDSLDEPIPYIRIQEITNTSLIIKFAPWCQTDSYYTYGSNIMKAVMERFRQEGIKLATPLVSIKNLDFKIEDKS